MATFSARCTMDNHLDHAVNIGLTADDEMCNFYLMYRTERGDNDDDGGPFRQTQRTKGNLCWSAGPPLYSWDGRFDYAARSFGAGLNNIPDEEASNVY